MSKAPRWISVGELARAFALDGNAPRPTHDLKGRTVSLHLEDGRVTDYRFETGIRLVWKITEGMGKGDGATETYFAAKVREGIYFVDFIEQSEAAVTRERILAIRDLIAATTATAKASLPNRVYSKELVELLFYQPYTKVQFLVDAGLAKRQTAASYLKELERVGILESQKVGRENLYLNKALYDPLAR